MELFNLGCLLSVWEKQVVQPLGSSTLVVSDQTNTSDSLGSFLTAHFCSSEQLHPLRSCTFVNSSGLIAPCASSASSLTVPVIKALTVILLVPLSCEPISQMLSIEGTDAGIHQDLDSDFNGSEFCGAGGGGWFMRGGRRIVRNA